MGRKAPRKRLARRVTSAFTRVFDARWRAQRVPRTHPNVSRRSAHPSIRVSEAKVKRPGRKKRAAGTRRSGLFDIVRWDYRERFSAEPQVGTRLSVLILRSARAGAVPQNRTRVRASRRMRTATAGPSCFETHRSARRLWKRLRSSCCDAPQHEGDGCAAHFWRNEAKPSVCVFDPREGPTCGCGKKSPALIACFRVVIYNEWHNQNA